MVRHGDNPIVLTMQKSIPRLPARVERMFGEQPALRSGVELQACRPTVFLRQILPGLKKARNPQTGELVQPVPRILELGCGDGVDARRFACLGYNVVAVDTAARGFWGFGKIAFCRADMRLVAEVWANNQFDMVYSNLGAHYFDDAQTMQLFRDIVRITRPGGHVCMMLNSTFDPEFETATPIVPGDINDPKVFWETGYRLVDGVPKRFFDLIDVARYIDTLPVEIIALDHRGKRNEKDKTKASRNFVRVILRKK